MPLCPRVLILCLCLCEVENSSRNPSGARRFKIRRDLCPISGKTLHRLDEEKMGLQCVVELSLFTELSPLRGHKVKRRGPHAGYRHETIEDGLAALGKAFCWGWRG